MQFSFELDNHNELSIDEIAAGFWRDLSLIINDTASWPTNSIALVAQEHSGIERIANNWVDSGVNRHIFKALSDFNEQELLHLLMRAEKGEIHLLVQFHNKPTTIDVSSADLKSRLANISIFLGLEPKNQILSDVFDKWCKHYGVQVQKSGFQLAFDSLNLDFVTLYKLVRRIKAEFAPGSKLGKDDILGIIE